MVFIDRWSLCRGAQYSVIPGPVQSGLYRQVVLHCIYLYGVCLFAFMYSSMCVCDVRSDDIFNLWASAYVLYGIKLHLV